MNILTICAHPDDEVLGCGATLARHAKRGDKVSAAFLTNGVGARNAASKQDAALRRKAAESAAKILGVGALEFGEFPDNRLDSVPLLDLVRHVEALVTQHRPDVIYTHHGADLNVDHRMAFQAVLTALRPIAGANHVRSIFSIEVASSTEWSHSSIGGPFVPNHFVAVSETFEQKLAALKAYGEEMRPAPHPRSLEVVRALAIWRGAAAGLNLAEAFAIVRQIESE